MVMILISPQSAISVNTFLSVDDLYNKKAAIIPIKTDTGNGKLYKSLTTITAPKKVKIKTNNRKKHYNFFFHSNKKSLTNVKLSILNFRISLKSYIPFR